MSDQKDSTTSGSRRWQQIRANKMNQKTANRIGQIGETASPAHKAVLRAALKDWAKKVKLSNTFPEIKDLLTSEAVYHLAFCSAHHNDRYARTIAVIIARAIVEGKTVEQCKQLFESKKGYYYGDINSSHASQHRVDTNPTEAYGESKQLAPGVANSPNAETIIYTMRHSIPRDEIYEGDVVTILVNGKCQNGAVGMAKIKRSFFGGYSDFGIVKVDRIYLADPEHIRLGESYHDIEKIEDVQIIGQVIHVKHKPLPPDKDGILDAELLYETDDDVLNEEIIIPPEPLARAPRAKSRTGTRRIPITVKRFEKYGILRGDKAIVVMNGDIRVGELGYFKIATKGYIHGGHHAFAIVCEQDSTCEDGYYNGKRTKESLCLRFDNVKKCQGHHNAEVYGRVCAIKRNGQSVEHALELRPFDEIMDRQQ